MLVCCCFISVTAFFIHCVLERCHNASPICCLLLSKSHAPHCCPSPSSAMANCHEGSLNRHTTAEATVAFPALVCWVPVMVRKNAMVTLHFIWKMSTLLKTDLMPSRSQATGALHFPAFHLLWEWRGFVMGMAVRVHHVLHFPAFCLLQDSGRGSDLLALAVISTIVAVVGEDGTCCCNDCGNGSKGWAYGNGVWWGIGEETRQGKLRWMECSMHFFVFW